MEKKLCTLLLFLLMLLPFACVCAEPDLTLQDPSAYSGATAEGYARILESHTEGIEAYQNYITDVTTSPFCRSVGFTDLTFDGIPEMLFWDLVPDEEYGFQVGRLWIYTRDQQGVHCALTFRPEIDDLLYSEYYLSRDGLLTIHYSDAESGWIMTLRQDQSGQYRMETLLNSQEDFSGEGPDTYYKNGKKITAKQFQSLSQQLRAAQGTRIGSLNVDEGQYGFTHTLDEAIFQLNVGEIAGLSEPKPQTASALPPSSDRARFPELSFFRGKFASGQKFPVYSAPSAKSWRGANGKASITSGSEIFIAGKSDGWILIMYELNSGVTRVGYINSKSIKGDYTECSELYFPKVQVALMESTAITDDPVLGTSIGRLKKGTKVTCLAEYRGWIYVETKIEGKTARGFVDPSSLDL